MIRIDGYLSEIVQRIEAGALVYVSGENQCEKWFIKFEDESELGLGNNFHLARQGVRAWVNSKKILDVKKSNNSTGERQ